MPIAKCRTILCAGLYAALAATTAGAASANAELSAKIQRFEATLDDATTDFRSYIVFFDPTLKSATATDITDALSAASAFAGVRLAPVRRLATGGWLVAASGSPSRSQANDVMRELAMRPEISHAQPDYRYQAASADPDFGAQWHLTGVVAPSYDCMPAATCKQAGANVVAGWSRSTGTGIVIAVLDTGYTENIDITQNLAAANVTTHKVGYDFVSSSPVNYDLNDPAIGDASGRDANAHDPGDYSGGAHSSWHGTHVMGLAAAAYNNNVYGAGVAPNAKLLPLRVLGAGGGSDSDIADAIIWASGGIVGGVDYNSTPAKVINMSLGGAHACTPSSNVQLAINAARANGTIVVVAAGNSSIDVSGFSPAGCSGVVAVGATGYTGAIAALNGGTPYSNYGAGVALGAPGGGYIREVETGWVYVPDYSTFNTGITTPGSASFAGDAGTSMAAPLVAGLAASIAALKPWLSPDQIRSYITANTHPWGTNGVPAASKPMGTGLMDAGAALTAAAGAIAPTGATLTASPASVTIPAGSTTAPYTLSWSAPGYATLDAYASINGGPLGYAGLVTTSGSAPEVATFGQTITWYLYPHGHTPTSALVKSVTVTSHY